MLNIKTSKLLKNRVNISDENKTNVKAHSKIRKFRVTPKRSKTKCCECNVKFSNVL